jgi:hypothetical protein
VRALARGDGERDGALNWTRNDYGLSVVGSDVWSSRSSAAMTWRGPARRCPILAVRAKRSYWRLVESPIPFRVLMTPTKCPQCGSLDCGPIRCRFTDETHVAYRDREASLAMIQRTIERAATCASAPAGGAAAIRGCYEAAKANYPSEPFRKPMPGDANYLNSSSRTEDRINAGGYFGGELHKRGR